MELWATDEHRIGLKPLSRRIWAPIGQRRMAPMQRRYACRFFLGLVHPASCRTLFHLATNVSIPLFEVELAALALHAGAGPAKQLVFVLDRAGWHASQRLRVPNHGHLLFQPPYSADLQPAERLWPLTNTPLINRHCASIEDLEETQVAHCAATPV
jgi:hypothetical protein